MGPQAGPPSAGSRTARGATDPLPADDLGIAVVPGIIALMFLTLFTVFGRPDIGFAVILILFVPMILFAWVGYARLKRRAAAYLADRARFEEEKKRLLDASVQTTTS